MSKNKNQVLSLDASAVSRALIENDLMDEYHWLPQDIAKIPYKKLVEMLIIKREKVNARENRRAIDNFKAENENVGKKTSRR